MTIPTESGQAKKFVRVVLPWLAGAAMLILYVATLNPWISFHNLTEVARSSGWVFGSDVTAPPLFTLLTAPFQWLPPALIPKAFNLFSAVCGALTMVLLARSVVLLPHDRTHDQRQRESDEFSLLSTPTAWIPPLLAVLVLGLQLTFWERATAGAQDMLDVLLLAYVIRCLLEFRVQQRDSWLLRAALVFGVAMTNHWLVVVLLPGFLVATLWIKGVEFFNLRFLGYLALCGICGLMFFLLLPTLEVFSKSPAYTFLGALKAELKLEKALIGYLLDGRHAPTNVLMLLTLTSLLPTLLIGIRWASYFGDPSPLGTALTTWVLHLVQAAFFGACIWVNFDPAFSRRHLGHGFQILTFLGPWNVNYLSALCVGYFSAYFLLVFRPIADRMRNISPWQRLLHGAAQTVIVLLLIAVPVGLVYKNLPQIRMSNGPALQQYASMLTRHLPDRGVLFCDTEEPMMDMPRKLWLVHGALDRAGKSTNYLFLDTTRMKAPQYLDLQAKLYSDRLPKFETKPGQPVDERVLLKLTLDLAEKEPLFYLHPSYGYYFELFYPEMHGLLFELKRYPTNMITRPPLAESLITENEKFWKTLRPELEKMVPFVQKPLTAGSKFHQLFIRKLHIPYEANETAAVVGKYYSQVVNVWGVQLQQAGRLSDASQHFDLALALNDNNLAARLNQDFNRELQTGEETKLRPFKTVEDELGKFRNWEQVLRETGPVDEPTHRFLQGAIAAQNGLLRQATEEFERVHALTPHDIPSGMWLARLYTLTRFPDKAISLLSSMRTDVDSLESTNAHRLELVQMQANALCADHRIDEANNFLRDTMDKNPRDPGLLALVFSFFTQTRNFSNAIVALDYQLQLTPNDTATLVNKGYLCLQLTNYAAAIPPLTRAMMIETNGETAVFNRALAYLGNDQLDEAQRDYERLHQKHPDAFQIIFGLGEIAWRRKDTNAAVRYYEDYLNSSPPNQEEAQMVRERLDSMKPPGPAPAPAPAPAPTPESPPK